VDGKTTVASTAQAQAFSSNAVLLTPLRLDDALKGLNQSFADNGYQEFPGGLIVQWGSGAAPTANSTTFYTLPKPFPNTLLKAVVSASGGTASAVGFNGGSATQIGVRCEASVPTGVVWIAIGY